MAEQKKGKTEQKKPKAEELDDDKLGKVTGGAIGSLPPAGRKGEP